MKKLILLSSVFIGLCLGAQARAADWLWAGASPWVYNNADGQWYFMQSNNSAVWMFGANTFELAPAAGFSPASLAGRTVTVTNAFGNTTLTFTANNTYTEVSPDGTFHGEYRYSKTGNNIAIIVLLEDGVDGTMTAIEATFSTANNGTITGRSTSVGDTEDITGNFTIQ